MGRIPVAAQVYSVRDEAEADFEKTMHRLAQMGYDGVDWQECMEKARKRSVRF